MKLCGLTLFGTSLLVACAGSPSELARPEFDTWMPEEYRQVEGLSAVPTGDHPDTPGTELSLDDGESGIDISLHVVNPQARRIGLFETLEIASIEGLDARIADERVVQLEAERDIANAAFYPRLSVGTGVYREEGRTQGNAGLLFDVNRQNATVGGRIDLVFDWGDARYNLRASSHRLDASLAERKVTVARLIRDAAWFYFDLIEAHALEAITTQALENARELVEHEATRFENGAGLEVDLLRARSHEAGMLRSLAIAEAQIEDASRRLGLLLGIDTLLIPADSDLREMILVHERDPENLVDLAVANHPEVHRTRALVLAAREGELSSKRGWLIPELILSAGYGGLGFNYDDLYSREVYTAALQWDVGFGEFSNERRASAQRREAELDAERARREVAAAVRRAELGVRTAGRAIEASIAEHSAAEKTSELAVVRHANGAGLLIEVMEADLNYRRASAALVQSITAHNRAQYELLAATGGVPAN